jgi:hypothetical protein
VERTGRKRFSYPIHHEYGEPFTTALDLYAPMAWKIERWLAEVFPGESEIYSEYRSLPPRELAIVSAAVLDIALAELLAVRLADHKKRSKNSRVTLDRRISGSMSVS